MTAELQFVALLLTAAIAVLNLFLIPITKSAMRGEAAEMFKTHDSDAQAHAGLTMVSKDAISSAAYKATDAYAAAGRVERALDEWREEVRSRLDALSVQIRENHNQMQAIHEAFVEHDTWERARYSGTPGPPLRKKKK